VAPADLEEVVRLYGMRNWVEQSYQQAKGQLGWADFQVRKDRAIRRHWELVCCAFCFCWWERLHPANDTEEPASARKRGIRTSTPASGRDQRAYEQLAGGAAPRPRVVGSVEHALALLERVEQCAPASGTARAA